MTSSKHVDLPCFFWVTPVLIDDHHYRKPPSGLVVLLAYYRRFHDTASGDQRRCDDCYTLEQQVEPAIVVSEAWRCLLVNRIAFYVRCRRLMHNLDALAALVHCQSHSLTESCCYHDCIPRKQPCPIAKCIAHCHCQYFNVLNRSDYYLICQW